MGTEVIYRCDKCSTVRTSEQQRFDITVNAAGPYHHGLNGIEQLVACSAACALALMAEPARWDVVLKRIKPPKKGRPEPPSVVADPIHPDYGSADRHRR